MSFHLSPRRLTAAALGVAAVLACAGPASAATPADAATWLSTDATAGGALTGGNHLEYGGNPQYGVTADALFALAASGGHLDTVATFDAWLQANASAYADPDSQLKDFPGPFGGAFAKLALTAEITSQDPHAYGGLDLLGLLQKQECKAPDANGYCSAPGDFYGAFSPISQSLGVIALQRSPVAADHLGATSLPVTRLLALECQDGLYSGDLLAPGDTCTTGDVDSTAYVAQALASVFGATNQRVTDALTALTKVQDATSGGFFNTAFQGSPVVNANSTGVALSALSLQPTTFAASITAATAFVQSLQQSDGRYDYTATNTSQDSAKQATAQALLGVLGRNLADPTLVVTLPTATTPPTTAPTAPTVGAPAPAGATAPELAATGASNGHLTTELLLAAVAIAGGAGLVGVGARRHSARHQA